ncbi:flippase-like domain-containing protein [Ectobacillus sp. JY-23]|nr:flippase-like domain-containing protein [Ectobacillus sp. JY-23]
MLFDMQSLTSKLHQLLSVDALLWMTIAYAFAFVLRAYAWRLYLRNAITVGEALAGLCYSLLFNHLSPVKAGDVVRVAAVTKKGRVSWAVALQSVIVLRTLDLLVLVAFAGVGAIFLLNERISMTAGVVLLLMGMTAGIMLWRPPRFVSSHVMRIKEVLFSQTGVFILLLTIGSWVAEAAIIYTLAPLAIWEAVWVNSITIAGQVFQFTPGGIGTYETVMTFALSIIGIAARDGYEWALLSHGFKFIFSYVTGLIVLVVFPIQFTKYWLRRGEKRWSK